MKAPEIDPEVRGLIEEIVANPRSTLRLAPKRALLPWIESGDTIRPSEVSKDAAARHLVAAHREAVAKLLREAAHIAYWKKPFMTPRPTGADGKPYDPASGEGAWKVRADERVRMTPHPDEGVELLRQCLGGIDIGRGLDLAKGSASLVPTEKATLAVAEHLKQVEPRTSLRLNEHVAHRARAPEVQGIAWGNVGSRLCHLRRFRDAGEAYENARQKWPVAWFCLFNLACLDGRSAAVLEAADEIARLWPADSGQVEESGNLLSIWARSLTPDQASRGRRILSELRDRLPEAARRVAQAYA